MATKSLQDLRVSNGQRVNRGQHCGHKVVMHNTYQNCCSINGWSSSHVWWAIMADRAIVKGVNLFHIPQLPYHQKVVVYKDLKKALSCHYAPISASWEVNSTDKDHGHLYTIGS